MSVTFKMLRNAALALAAMTASTAGANAADVIAPGPYYAAEPDSLCAETRNLKAIQRRFNNIQAVEVHHNPDLEILQISGIEQTRYLPEVEDIRSVERLYCRGHATMSDGHDRTIWYLIEINEGFAGFGAAFGDNVEFCLSGLDPWNVYNAYCRVLR